MSMQQLRDGLKIVDANRSRGFFGGPCDDKLVAAAETAIGIAFPPTYREFVRQLSAGNFRAFEIYGVTGANFDRGKVPNGIWLTLQLRREGAIPPNFLVIADAGDGAYYCLDLRPGGQECPVVIYEPAIPTIPQRPEKVAEDFGEFFLSQVQQALAFAKMSPAERQQAAQPKPRGTLPD